MFRRFYTRFQYHFHPCFCPVAKWIAKSPSICLLASLIKSDCRKRNTGLAKIIIILLPPHRTMFHSDIFQHLIHDFLRFPVRRSRTSVSDIGTHRFPVLRQLISYHTGAFSFRIVRGFPAPDRVSDIKGRRNLIVNTVIHRFTATLSDPDRHIAPHRGIQKTVQIPYLR